jgi:hypothetical protein
MGGPGKLQYLSREQVVQMGREGGKVSGIARREKIIHQFMKDCQYGNLYDILIKCYRRGYQAGFERGRKCPRKSS